jgi:hypothetical protein
VDENFPAEILRDVAGTNAKVRYSRSMIEDAEERETSFSRCFRGDFIRIVVRVHPSQSLARVRMTATRSFFKARNVA